VVDSDDSLEASQRPAPSATTVRSVARAFELLSMFTPRHAEWTVGALAKATGINKSVVTRLMATMANAGFVAQDSQTRTYRVGGKAFAVGNSFSPYIMLSRLARPVLEDLTAQCGYSCSVGVPDGDRFMTCVSIQSTSIRVAPEAGQRQYYHGSSVGKALLAGMTEDQLGRIIQDAPLPALGPNTMTTAEALRADLQRIRERGYSITSEESSLLVGGVAAAIGMRDGGVLAAIGIAYPVHLVSDEMVAVLGKQVIAATGQLCLHLAPQGNAVLFQPMEF